MDEPVRDQYEAYPYPARDPKDEGKRLIAGSPSNLAEIDHYVFAGRGEFAKPFRALVAGGDTSSHAARQLGLSALTLATPIAPGSPLCRGHAPGGALDGLEIALKGGQVGGATYFRQVLDGTA